MTRRHTTMLSVGADIQLLLNTQQLALLSHSTSRSSEHFSPDTLHDFLPYKRRGTACPDHLQEITRSTGVKKVLQWVGLSVWLSSSSTRKWLPERQAGIVHLFSILIPQHRLPATSEVFNNAHSSDSNTYFLSQKSWFWGQTTSNRDFWKGMKCKLIS